MRTPASRLRDPRERKIFRCGGGKRARNDPLPRITSIDDTVSVYGWPSRGGVIILKDTTHVDFEFLGLSTTDPPLLLLQSHGLITSSSKDVSEDRPKPENVNDANDTEERSPSQTIKEKDENEDTFCQILLLLGAKWWDSKKRDEFVRGFAADEYPYVTDVRNGKVAEPTPRERRWVKVGWEQPIAAASSKIGGFWILDRDGLETDEEEDILVPEDAAMIKLAKTMEERCAILKKMGATYHASLDDYQSEHTFLKAWEWKWEGEVGPLRKVDRWGIGVGDGGEGVGRQLDHGGDQRSQQVETQKASN